MNSKITGIVAYFSWIGWLIAFLAGDRQGAKFHLNQALVLMIANLINSVLPWFKLTFISTILGWILTVLWVVGLLYAIRQENKELPIIGGIKILN